MERSSCERIDDIAAFGSGSKVFLDTIFGQGLGLTAHVCTAAPGWDIRCQVNMADIGQSRPDSGRGVKAQFFTTCAVVPSSLKSGLQVEMYKAI